MHKIEPGRALDDVTRKLVETERALEECRIEYRLLLETCLEDFRPAAFHRLRDSSDLRGQFDATIGDILNYCGDACDIVRCGQANVVELNKAIGKILAGGRIIAHLHRLSRIVCSHEDSSHSRL